MTEEKDKNQGIINKYLIFSLGSEEYAVPLLKVKEVIAIPEFTPLPFAPKYFLGIMNLRGQVVSVVDLRKKLEMKIEEEKSESNVIIILDLEPIFLGVVVDSVNKVIGLAESEVSGPPDMLETGKGATVSGIARKDSKLILILDVAATLNVEDLVAIQKNINSNNEAA